MCRAAYGPSAAALHPIYWSYHHIPRCSGRRPGWCLGSRNRLQAYLLARPSLHRWWLLPSHHLWYNIHTYLPALPTELDGTGVQATCMLSQTVWVILEPFFSKPLPRINMYVTVQSFGTPTPSWSSQKQEMFITMFAAVGLIKSRLTTTTAGV